MKSNEELYLTSKRRSRAMKIPERNDHSHERSLQIMIILLSKTNKSKVSEILFVYLPGMTMSPSPSMAKLLASKPFSSKSCGKTTRRKRRVGMSCGSLTQRVLFLEEEVNTGIFIPGFPHLLTI